MPGELNENALNRFTLMPGTWDFTQPPKGLFFEAGENSSAPPLAAPIEIYHHYDSDYVDFPNSVHVYRWDDEKSDWWPYVTVPKVEENIVVSVAADQWGNYFIAKNYALSGKKRHPWPDD